MEQNKKKDIFRNLYAQEIEVRPEINKGGVKLLLFKDARCDQAILDDSVGPMNWQRRHNRDNANCVVSIWDEEKKAWVEKEDTGTTGDDEALKEKGIASDSFKRACVNWGIGRELYSAKALNLFIPKEHLRGYDYDNNQCKDRFNVKEVEYEGKIISKIVITVWYNGSENY